MTKIVTELNNDIKIREYLLKKLNDAAVSSVEIERRKDKVEVNYKITAVDKDGRESEGSPCYRSAYTYRYSQHRKVRSLVKTIDESRYSP